MCWLWATSGTFKRGFIVLQRFVPINKNPQESPQIRSQSWRGLSNNSTCSYSRFYSALTERTLGTWTSWRAVRLHLACETSLIAPTWVSEQDRERRTCMRLVVCSQVCAALTFYHVEASVLSMAACPSYAVVNGVTSASELGWTLVDGHW